MRLQYAPAIAQARRVIAAYSCGDTVPVGDARNTNRCSSKCAFQVSQVKVNLNQSTSGVPTALALSVNRDGGG